MNFQLLAYSTGNEAPVQAMENERIRLTFEKECRGHYGEEREHLSGSYCDISAWGCFSLEKALVGGGPGLRASSIYLNTSSLLMLGLHTCCALNYLLKINPSIKPRGVSNMSLTEERRESSSGPGCFNTGPAGLPAECGVTA